MTTMVIGAGMAGLTCADALICAGHAVIVLDKGRGPGGRLASRRLDTDQGQASFDLGTQAFTAHSPAFVAQLRRWASNGHAAPWLPAGGDSWVGVPAMNAPLRAMAANLDVRWHTRVTGLSHRPGNWRVEADTGEVLEPGTVVVALPAEQTAALLMNVETGTAGPMAARAAASRSLPCWTVLLAFAEPLVGVGDYLAGNAGDALAKAVRNTGKPGRSGPEAWVVHAGADWSSSHLEDSADRVADALIAALSERLDRLLPPIIARAAHRWRFATSVGGGTGPVWDPATRLGVCGDWLAASGVEGAWLSGRDLADHIQATGSL